jgi:prevent-host-death family protein
MMTYSIYEAKAKFSEVIRLVRQGRTVTVTHRGEPVAEIRPLTEKETLDQRLRRLEAAGAIHRAVDPKAPLEPIARRPGALQRFLKDRNE